MTVLSVSRSTFWLLFNLFASALALKEEKVFTWIYMSTHTHTRRDHYLCTHYVFKFESLFPSTPVLVPADVLLYLLCH